MSFVPRPYAPPADVEPPVGDSAFGDPASGALSAAEPCAAAPPAPTRLALSTRTPTEAAQGALHDAMCDAVRVLAGASAGSGHDAGALDLWEDEGGPRTRPDAADLSSPGFRGGAARDAAVDDAAAENDGLLPPAAFAALQRDAAQCCRAAYAGAVTEATTGAVAGAGRAGGLAGAPPRPRMGAGLERGATGRPRRPVAPGATNAPASA